MRLPIRVALVAVALCLWCGWVSGFHRSTDPARVTWAISLAAIVVIDVLLWRGRRGLRPGWRIEAVSDPWPRAGRGGGRRLLVGLSPWLGLASVVLAWEILGLLTGPGEPHLTISALSQAFRPLNAALLLAWMVIGVGYGLARARAPLTRQAGTGRLSVVAPVPANFHPGGFGPALLLGSSRAVGIGFWLGVVVAAAVIDLGARRSRGTLANGEELLRVITASLVANVLLIVAWGYAGWHLFAH